MLFQAELSESLQVVSDFRLLNGSDPIIVGLGDDGGESLKFLREVLSESPAGPTPLCSHIEAIVQCIQSVENDLRANGQKAVVMIATDGESSDGNVAEALRPLTNVSTLLICSFRTSLLIKRYCSTVACVGDTAAVYRRGRCCRILE